MAETAKIVNPTRRVLLPDLAAGCSLADSCPAEKLAAAKAADPSLYVVAYINCSAAVKALCERDRHERQRLEDRQPRARRPEDPLRP
jgi:quinolinate synthase